MILEEQIVAYDFSKNAKKYFKHPATWLNGLCWEDEIEGAETLIGEDGTPLTREKDGTVWGRGVQWKQENGKWKRMLSV